ncbi:MAG: glycosyltransferase family 4 protein [Proteobacteria bacterium]|nr:glycosyltransferase family 4 protein [Pseudomonadota bacterium]
MSVGSKKRILFLYPGFVPPNANPEFDKHYYLSRDFSGVILLPVWWKNEQEAKSKLSEINNAEFIRADFKYKFFYAYAIPSFLRSFFVFFFFLSQGIREQRKDKFSVIVSYGANLTGVAACLLKLVTGAELIIDLPGVPSKAYLYDAPEFSFKNKIKKLFSDLNLRFCCNFADKLKLMSLGQLTGFESIKRIPHAIFHEFVPIGKIQKLDVDENYLLFIGFPWYLKGVDLLIKAFNEVVKKYPDYQLKIVGHCEELSYFENLVENKSKVEFLPGQTYERAIELMQKCSIFILPSRTEAMGRVVLEAMACGKLVIASDADGLPDYVSGRGLLFESGNFKSLAEKIILAFEDKENSKCLAGKAYEYALTEYSEIAYLEKFKALINS